jgi:hypothetical protein
MKLRYRKTGKIIELELIQINDNYLNEHELETIYGEPITLEVLNKYCEDYKPKEPLIKDEKIRKAVRAWAEANKFSIFIVNVKHSNTFEIRGLADIGDAHGCSIYFKGTISKANNITYTIAELCGEEEK